LWDLRYKNEMMEVLGTGRRDVWENRGGRPLSVSSEASRSIGKVKKGSKVYPNRGRISLGIFDVVPLRALVLLTTLSV
jgi:hypothetical protein